MKCEAICVLQEPIIFSTGASQGTVKRKAWKAGDCVSDPVQHIPVDGVDVRDAKGAGQPPRGHLFRVHALADDSEADHASGGLLPFPLIGRSTPRTTRRQVGGCIGQKKALGHAKLNRAIS